jgi:hypothetical protein
LVVVGHTRKADLIYRGPQVIAGDCDNIIYAERIERELKANVHCEFSRNAAEFDDFGFVCALVPVMTDTGPQDYLAVTDATAAHDTKGKSDDEELAWRTLLAFYLNPDTWTMQTAWFEATKTARGGKLGNTTFSNLTKALVANGRVRVNAGGLYQVVWGAPAQGSAGLDSILSTPLSKLGSSRSSYSHSPPKGGELGVTSGGTPGSTPGVPGVNSSESRTDEKSVVPDAGHDAVEQLLKGKTKKSG